MYNYITHVGIKGMKWGHRKAQQAYKSYSANQRPNSNNKKKKPLYNKKDLAKDTVDVIRQSVKGIIVKSVVNAIAPRVTKLINKAIDNAFNNKSPVSDYLWDV